VSIAEGVGIRLFGSAVSKLGVSELGVSRLSVIIVVVRSERDEGTANVPFGWALSRRRALCLGTSMLKSQLNTPDEPASIRLTQECSDGCWENQQGRAQRNDSDSYHGESWLSESRRRAEDEVGLVGFDARKRK
jgi:hypothetical protein